MTPRCSAMDLSTTPTKSARTVPMYTEYGEENDDSDIDGCDMPTAANFGVFDPLYAVSIWKEPDTMTRLIILAVVFPPGADAGGFLSACLRWGTVT